MIGSNELRLQPSTIILHPANIWFRCSLKLSVEIFLFLLAVVLRLTLGQTSVEVCVTLTETQTHPAYLTHPVMTLEV